MHKLMDSSCILCVYSCTCACVCLYIGCLRWRFLTLNSECACIIYGNQLNLFLNVKLDKCGHADSMYPCTYVTGHGRATQWKRVPIMLQKERKLLQIWLGRICRGINVFLFCFENDHVHSLQPICSIWTSNGYSWMLTACLCPNTTGY